MNIGAQTFRRALKAKDTINMKTQKNVQKAPDDIRWEIDRNEFDELMAATKESAQGPDGIPYGLYRCAGGLGGFAVSLSRVQTCSGGSHCPCVH